MVLNILADSGEVVGDRAIIASGFAICASSISAKRFHWLELLPEVAFWVADAAVVVVA